MNMNIRKRSGQNPKNAMTSPHCPIRLILLVTLILGAMAVPGVSATEYTVALSGADFTEIQPAISWAMAGDSILVRSGLYAERLRITKQVSLTGVDSGRGAPMLDAEYEGAGIEILADGCTVQGFLIHNSNTAGGIRVSSNGNTLTENILKENAQGIVLVSADKNTVTGNTITDNTGTGIALEDSDDNLIENNRVLDNSVGIVLDDASRKNQIYHNSFANTKNVIATGAASVWESPSMMSYTYHSGTFVSRMGNYWGNYHGQDPDGDGIGTTPYVISVASKNTALRTTTQDVSDLYPLVESKDNYYAITAVPGTGSVSTPTPATVMTPPVVIQTVIPRTPVITAASTPTPTSTAGNFVLPDLGRVPWVPVLGGLVVVCGAGAVVFWYRAKKRRDTSPQEALRIVPPSTPDTVAYTETITEPFDLFQTDNPPGTADKAKKPDSIHANDQKDDAITTGSEKSHKTAETIPSAEAEEPAGNGQPFYLPPDLKSKYTNIRYIGRGGVAHVFAAHRKTDGKLVAVKIPISFDEITGKCFLNEIAAWKKLNHPNIVEVLATNILPVPYVEMEYVPGSLEEVKKPIPVWKAVHIVNSIADALQYAHSRGIIHRDIKPHNILVTADFVPKITDWGMSKIVATEMQRSSVAGFSLSYAAPEQVSPADFGHTDARTDIYQLGVVFYELVTGSIPFGGDSVVEVGNAIVRDDPVPPSKYCPDAASVETIILKCLKKDPADRYQTAFEITEALAGYLDEDGDDDTPEEK